MTRGRWNSQYPTLDMHGEPHHGAENLIEDFILENLEVMPVAIVTGHSAHFQNIVLSMAKKWNLEAHDQWWWHRRRAPSGRTVPSRLWSLESGHLQV